MKKILSNCLFLLGAYQALLRPYRKDCALIIVGLGTQILFYVLYPLLFKHIFDRAIPDKDFSLLLQLIAAVGVLLVCCGLGAYLQLRTIARVGGRVLSDMRQAMALKLNALGFSFHASVVSVDLVSRFSSDMDRIEKSLTRALPALGESVLVTLCCLVTIAFLDWRMGLVAVLLLPVGFVGNALFGAKEDALNSQSRNLKNHMLGSVEDLSQSWHLIHAFNDQRQIRSRFESSNESYTRSATSESYYNYLAPVLADYSINLSMTVVVLVGAALAMNGGLTVGAFLGCFALLRKVADGSGRAAKTYATFVGAVRPCQRVQKLLDEPVSIAAVAQATALAPLAREIRFQAVSYGYRPGVPVLREINFTIAAGTSVAIVGATGSGKSTILKLILRIVDPAAGSVSFDGVDIRRATVASVRQGSANVLQECHIIRGTIAENLRFARAAASDGDIVDAARKAGIHNFITSLPLGYQTPLDYRGSSLSGGQRQGIAIARALVLDPSLLLLDEPTSMLDPITESKINRVIEQLADERTVIMSTHRLESARRMTRILVLHEGVIAEAGSHDELIARNGLYRSMWEKQQGFSIRADGVASVTPQRLQAIPIFRGLGQEGLRELIEQFESENFEPGECVVREGEPGGKFYITVRGTLEVRAKGAHAVQRRLGILQDGDHFGEVALLKSVPRTATVVAMANTQCLSLSRERFNRLIETQPELLRSLEESMAQRRSAEGQGGDAPASAGGMFESGRSTQPDSKLVTPN